MIMLQRQNKFVRLGVQSAIAVVILSLGVSVAYASSSTISSTNKYAWSNYAGWINFNPTQAGVTVTDSKLTGYAWSANDGWINFSPSGGYGGVTNSNGTLSGFAWDSSAGWVNFSGVTIDSSGKFHGQATGGTINGVSYKISFDCTHCDVETTWRPTATQTQSQTPGSISPVFFALPPNTNAAAASPTLAASTSASAPNSTSPATVKSTTSPAQSSIQQNQNGYYPEPPSPGTVGVGEAAQSSRTVRSTSTSPIKTLTDGIVATRQFVVAHTSLLVGIVVVVATALLGLFFF